MTNKAHQRPPSRVLVIDKDSVRRGMVACTITDDVELEFANSPETGLDLLRQMEPDVVIVSPETTPSDICQRIRAQQAGSSCLLMVMDESFENEDIGETSSEECGADTFLPFPFERHLFEHRVNEGQLRRKRQTMARLVPPVPESGQQAIPASPSGDGAVDDEWAEFRVEVATLHDQLESLDYYSLMRLSPEASSREVKDTYFEMALHFHPDRLIRHPDTQLKHEVYEIYKRLSEAFSVLSDPVSRRHYDTMLCEGRKLGNLRYNRQEHVLFAADTYCAAAQTALGRRFLYFARRAEEEGRLRTAHSYLSLALRQEPRNEEILHRVQTITERLRQPTPP